MIEYPSMINASQAPRKNCIAFDKIDGSNFRAKYVNIKGKLEFNLFGTRRELINESSFQFRSAFPVTFRVHLEQPLLEIFKSKAYREYREIIVFGEYVGENSFAGNHDIDDLHEIILFDVLLGHKDRKLVHPKDLIKDFGSNVKIPKVIYQGILNDEFIESVRNNEYNLNEGVVCKGTERSGAYFGGIWQAKIKTNQYLEKLKKNFGEKYLNYYE